MLLGVVLFYLHLSSKWPLSAGTEELWAIVTNDGPTTIGGRTTVIATLSRPTPSLFQFCWFVDHFEEKEKCNIARYNDTFVKSDWKSPGMKNIEVNIQQHPHPVREVSGSTVVLVTDYINAKLVATPNSLDNTFQVGPVNLSVDIYDPSNMFGPKSVIYHWNFDDSTSPPGDVSYKETHTFREDRTYRVRVLLNAETMGRAYNGSVEQNLTVQITFDVDVHVTGPQGTITTKKDNAIYVAKGEVKLQLVYNNPYSLVTNLSTDWSFGDGSTSLHGWEYATVKHNYTKQGAYSLWVTPRLITKHNKYDVDPLSKLIYTKDPITALNVTHIPTTNETKSKFLITCKGSGPFKMCWKFIKARDLDNTSAVPFNCSNWSPDTCSFLLNDTRKDGEIGYLNITVTSYVSRKAILTQVPVSGSSVVPTHPAQRQSAGTIAAETLLSIFIGGTAMIFLIVYGLRRLYKSRQRAILETADFDFRDDDCRSIDSFKVEETRKCFPFRMLNGCANKSENYPLLAHWDNNSSSLYSEIL